MRTTTIVEVTAGSEAVQDLLPLVFAAPNEALTKAESVLRDRPEPLHASVAHQVIGIWQRDFGDMRLALRHLRRACDWAARAGSADREADVLATLGVALVHSGRTRQGLDALGRGVQRGTGHTRAGCCSGGRTRGGCWAITGRRWRTYGGPCRCCGRRGT